jgi:hypothetical protein
MGIQRNRRHVLVELPASPAHRDAAITDWPQDVPEAASDPRPTRHAIAWRYGERSRTKSVRNRTERCCTDDPPPHRLFEANRIGPDTSSPTDSPSPQPAVGCRGRSDDARAHRVRAPRTVRRGCNVVEAEDWAHAFDDRIVPIEACRDACRRRCKNVRGSCRTLAYLVWHAVTCVGQGPVVAGRGCGCRCE